MYKKQLLIFLPIFFFHAYIDSRIDIGNFTYGYLPHDKKAAFLEELFKNKNHPSENIIQVSAEYKGIYFDHIKKIHGSIPDRTIDIYIACLNKHCGSFLKIIHSRGKRRENISYDYVNIENDILNNELNKNPKQYFNYIQSLFKNDDENESQD